MLATVITICIKVYLYKCTQHAVVSVITLAHAMLTVSAICDYMCM